MRIDEQKIEEVRSSVDIVEVISQFVKLKKRGKSYLGLCPFHQEKTPSFTVSADKQMYHCFGCHKGGNVFTFVMEMEKISFVEAVRSLAEKTGIVIPDEHAPSTEQATETENLLNACKFAAQTFHNQLMKTDEGKSALAYFRKRGFTEETIRVFGLGYSMNSWDEFAQKAKIEGLQTEILAKAGLVRLRDDGSPYDYYRGRAMFPIFSTSLRVIGFGARKMREDDPIAGKYINSPETPIYNKSRVLYGLSHSKDAIRQEERALMVEGYADLISLFQAGIQNVVASSGTALTEDQLALLARYTKRITLVYDADSAGSNATIRGIDLALERDFDVEVVELPEGEDPDSFVQKNGAKAFRELLQGAVSFIDFKAKQFLKSGSFATPEGKAEAVRSIVQSIAKMKDELKRSFFIKDVAEKYDIYETILLRELERWTGKEKKYASSSSSNQSRYAHPEPAPKAEPIPTASDMVPAERDVLKLMMEGDPAILQFITSHISAEHLHHEQARALYLAILEQYEVQGVFDLNMFLQEMQDSRLSGFVSDIAMSKYELSPKWGDMEKRIEYAEPADIARAAVKALHRLEIATAIEANQRALKEAHASGEQSHEILQQLQQLLEFKKQIEHPDYLRS